MQVIGFSFSKILVERNPSFKRGPIDNNIEFTNIETEKVDVIEKDMVKASFRYTLLYKDKDTKSKQGEVLFEGVLLISFDDEEMKEVQKAWKKKELPNNIKVPLFNIILKKCSSKAGFLEDEVGLPPHIPIPQLTGAKP
jgi:hypothetical protein